MIKIDGKKLLKDVNKIGRYKAKHVNYNQCMEGSEIGEYVRYDDVIELIDNYIYKAQN